MPPKRASVSNRSMKVEVSEGSDDEMNSSSRRRSTRTPKPRVQKKSLKDASDSEEEELDSDSGDSSGKKTSGKGGRTPLKRGAGGSTAGNKSKKARKDKSSEEMSVSEEDEGSDSDFEEIETPAKKSGSKPAPRKASSGGGARKNAVEDDEDGGELVINLPDDDIDSPDWTEPDYNDQAWFKKNCLICQACNKMYEQTGDALKCFHKHKDNMRCYVCFTVIKGGRDGTKRLFKHYQNRHKKGGKPNTLQCPHCKDTFAYKSMSCHIISTHFRQALGLPDKAKEQAAAAKNGASNGTKNGGKPETNGNGKKKLAEEDEEEDSVEEEEEADEDMEEEEEEDD